MNTQTCVAVLTGDIVGSQRLKGPALDRARSTIQTAAKEVSAWAPDLMPLELEFARGDSWQLLLTDPSQAFRAALHIRSTLLYLCSVDTRVSIGIGQVSSMADTLALSDGSAFIRSGRGLDAMGKERLSVSLSTPSDTANWVDLVARLCDVMVRSWTTRQAELVHAALQPGTRTHEDIAGALVPVVTKQAVGKGLRAARWESISDTLAQFEHTDWPAQIR